MSSKRRCKWIDLAPFLCLGTVALVPTPSRAQLTPAGEPFELTQTRGIIERPAVAYGADGNILALWHLCDFATDGRDCTARIHARRFDDRGQPLGDEFPVNEDATEENFLERLVASPDGTYLAVWSRETRFGPGFFYRALAADGSPLGPEVALKIPRRDENVGLESEGAIGLTAAPDGTFLAIWDQVFRNKNRIEAQKISATGELLGDTFKVNELSVGGYTAPSAAFTPQGDLIATWLFVTLQPAGFRYSLQARRFSSDGTPLTGDLLVDDLFPAKRKLWPRVVGLEGGGFAVVWSDQVFEQDILGRQFDRRNRPVGGRLLLSTSPARINGAPSISHRGDARAIAAWEGVDASGTSGIDIRARVLEPRGRASGVELNLSAESSAHQRDLDLVSAADGTVLVAWVEEAGDATRVAAFARLYDLGPAVPAWPARPTGLRAESVSGSEARLTWNDNSDDEDDFEIEVRGPGSSWLSVATAATDSGTAVVDGLEPGQRYKFRVRARNGAGASNWSNRARASLPGL